MKTAPFYLLLCFFLSISIANAQQIKQLNLQIKLVSDWKHKTEETEKIRLHAEKKTAIIEIYNYQAATSEQATLKMIDVLKERGIKPDDFMKSTRANLKIGQQKYATFEGLILTELESTKTTMKQSWKAYLTEVKGQKVFIYASEFTKDDAKITYKEDTEKMLKTLK